MDADAAEAADEDFVLDFDDDDATGDILDFFFGFGIRGRGRGCGCGCGITISFFGLPFFVVFSFSHFQVSLFRTVPSLHFKTHLRVIGFLS
jgi:hypothetical protein